MYLYVDLPRFDFPVVFSEIEYPAPSLPFLSNASAATTASGTGAGATGTVSSVGGVSVLSTAQGKPPDVFAIVDPEVARDNPVEAKHTRLYRSHRTGPLDRELRPEKSVRDELDVRSVLTSAYHPLTVGLLQKIMNYPPTTPMTRKDRDLTWRFRFYLTREKRALTKFLKSVSWSDPGEVKQAVDVLLPLWCDIAIDDALELLGSAEEFRDPRVRGFAVKQLGRADDEELILYLLQLVQALKFEGPGAPGVAGSMASTTLAASQMRVSRHSRMLSTAAQSAKLSEPQITLEDFLIDRAVKNPVLGNQFYWYLAVESEDLTFKKMYEKVAKRFASRLQEVRGASIKAGRRLT